MDNRRWDPCNEAELERLLSEGLSAPPEDVLADVTPWRRAVNRLLWGLVLCTITFQFANLHYILPTVGMALILLGLRSLWRENGFFAVWWWTHLVRMGAWSFVLLYQAAPGWQGLLNSSAFTIASAAVNVTLQLVQFLCLWQGFREIRRKVGLPPGVNSGAALVAWYALVAALGLMTYQGWLGTVLLLIAYICILRGLYKISVEMEEAGYILQPAPIRVSDRTLALLLLSGLLTGVLGINAVTSRLPMDWQPPDPDRHSQVEEIKARLLELDFPAEVLEDLTAEDILACDGAVRAFRRTKDCHLASSYDDTTPTPMRSTTVAVELPGGQWRIFHHFLWVDNVGLYGSEAIQLWPAYQDKEGWAKSGEITGQVLYDKRGTTYAAPFHSLEEITYTANSFFFGPETRTDIFADFSLPRGGARCRGYVAYGITELEESWYINSWCNYVHCLHPFQYPAKTALEWRMEGNIFSENLYHMMQTDLQFNPQSPDGLWS